MSSRIREAGIAPILLVDHYQIHDPYHPRKDGIRKTEAYLANMIEMFERYSFEPSDVF